MTEQVYIGVDLGAEFGRVDAGIWNGQQMRMEEVLFFQNGPVSVGGSLRWDPIGLWSKIKQALAIAARRYGSHIVSAGVDTWGVDFVLMSANDEMLGLPFHYRDTRTRGVMEHALETIPREEIFEVTGVQFMGINTVWQLMAMRKTNPEVFWIANKFLMMPDYFHWCLCDSHATEFTNATTTQCFNARERRWAVELLERLGLPTKMFPDIVTPGTRLGTLRPEIAAKTGLPRIHIVAPATHDTASAIAATPTLHTGKTNWAYLSSSTWSLMGLELQDAMVSRRVMALNLTNEGGVDASYRLLKNIMGLWLEHQCRHAFKQQGHGINEHELQHLAAQAPPFRSLINPDDERFLNPADMTAAIRDFCRETGQAQPENEGQYIRCVYESLALQYARVLNWLEELAGHPVETIHILRRGSANATLNQFTANACERPVLAGPHQATSLGNVLVQARAAGELKSLHEMRTAARHSCELQEFAPDAAAKNAWAEARARFAKLVG